MGFKKIYIDKAELQLAVQTLSLNETCIKFNCSKSTIWNNCRDFGLSFPKSNDDSIVDMRRAVLSSYKSGALRRNHTFELSDEEFYNIIQQPCKYCGRQGTNELTPERMPGTSKKRKPFIFTGIDREDSAIGYTTENSVPCCKRCNYGKNDCTAEEFREWIKALVNHNRHELIN